jgi:hypothetical protein
MDTQFKRGTARSASRNVIASMAKKKNNKNKMFESHSKETHQEDC